MDSIEHIVNVCDKLGIENYTIREDNSIDVNGNVFIRDNFNILPISFNIIRGSFDIGHNGLYSLEGCPHTIVGDFLCNHNQISTLEGGPKYVKGIVDCWCNNLTDLTGGPLEVGRIFTDKLKIVGIEYSGMEIVNYNQWVKLNSRKRRINKIINE